MNKWKSKKAFTLMEMLITVGLLVVLLAIGVPAVSKYILRIKMEELDQHAKTIFLEAQNQLTARRADGSTYIYDTARVSYSSHFLSEIGDGEVGCPADFDTDKDGEEWKQFCWLGSSDSLMSEIISDRSFVRSQGGGFIIEFNPADGTVYSVFYWENGTEVDYEEDIVGKNRDWKTRSAIKAGYYGGTLENVLAEDFALDQKITLMNDEELYVKVSYRLTGLLMANYTSSLTVQITVTDEEGNSYSDTLNATDMANSRVVLDRLEVYYLLESMENGYSFNEITGLAPGNITVFVHSEFDDGTNYAEETDSVSGSSLFETQNSSVIEVAAVRHLRNLGAAYFPYSGAVTISQTAEIDFASDEYVWRSGSYTGSSNAYRPTAFEPIENNGILQGAGSAYNGNTNALKNFVLSGSGDYIGLFATAEKTSFSRIRMEDMTVGAENVTGQTAVGTLAGMLTDCTVSNCGAYLSTEDADGAYYSETTNAETEAAGYLNEMDRRYDTFGVWGTGSVGGLCGIVRNSEISSSFAAVKVTGKGEDAVAGGLFGTAEGVSQTEPTYIDSSYASGTVTCEGTASGGLLGEALYCAVSSTYATGGLYAEKNAGGFVGNSENSSYTACTSYGQVLNENGAGAPAASGGFVASENSSEDTFSGCAYLKQDGYNSMDLTGPDDVSGQYYNTFKVTNEVSSSHPYDVTLLYKAFPFQMVTVMHYGNWPAQYVIDTSLVYYERYADNKYGYYGVTTLSSANTGAQDELVWVLNTLQDRECVEDGYALLSLYNLESIKFDLSVDKQDTNGTATTDVTTFSVAKNADTAAGEIEMALLRQQTGLMFKGYMAAEGETLDTHTDYSVLTEEDSFTVSGMYLYQLPYALQCTDRTNAYKFYDKLTAYAGYAPNNDTPVIGGATADSADNMIFYYCSHFAKNAINPGMNKTGTEVSYSAKAYVRSARQLNLLGRYSYYWNGKYGYSNDQLQFIQETDINFGTYTKSYCGVTYDLMNTSAANTVNNVVISNKVIGWTDQSGAGGRFSNNYNGNYNKIIDYRVESSEQFVGLFGEIGDGAIIQNIIMTVSGKYDAYIKSNYQYTYTTANPNGENSFTAIGALVGLSYMMLDDNNQPIDNTIKNCTAAGYEVSYEDSIGGARPASMGGLVGISMSSIYNCSAANEVIYRPMIDNMENPVSLGGLTGSFYFAEMANCYSGGSLAVENPERLTGTIAAGGLSGANVGVWTQYVNISNPTLPDTDIHHVYSYTQLAFDETFENKNLLLYPVTGVQEADLWDTGGSYLVMRSDRTFTNGAYLAQTLADGLTFSGDGSTAMDYQTLEKFALSSDAPYQYGKAANTYPVSQELSGKNYTFPAVVYDENESFVHYGDWPYASFVSEVSKKYPAYLETYADGTYGVYYVKEDGSVYSGLSSSKEITETAYGVLTYQADATKADKLTAQVRTEEMLTYYFYEEALAAVTETQAGSMAAKHKSFSFIYEFVTLENGAIVADSVPKAPVTLTLYANEAFGAAISASNTLGSSLSEPLQVRTTEQFFNIALLSETAEAYLKQTHDISLAGAEKSVSLTAGNVYDGGGDAYDNDGFFLTEAKVTVFSTNNGTIQNTVLKNSSIAMEGERAAMFVDYNVGTIQNCAVLSETTYTENSIRAQEAAGFAEVNYGTIQNCFVTGTVTGTEAAAGFVLANYRTITNCYVNAQVNAEAAAGFALNFLFHSGAAVPVTGGTVTNSYSAGSTSASGTAYGFLGAGTASDCYSVSAVSGTEASYGFAPAQDAAVTNCCWGYTAEHNAAVGEQGLGERVTLDEIPGKLASFGTAGTEAVPYDTALGTVYPYPAVAGLKHYGDWPLYYKTNHEVISGEYVGLFYYEKYADRTYGIYAVGFTEETYEGTRGNNLTGTMVFNSLSNKPLSSPTEIGSGVFYYDTLTASNWWERAGRNGTWTDVTNGTAILSSDGYTFIAKTTGTAASNSYSRQFNMSNRGQGKTLTLYSATIENARPE